MRQSKLFTKTRKETPADEVSKNAQLLIRAGFIHKEMAGVYSVLPLGLRVVKKIKDIIQEEMLLLGSQELIMSTLQNKEIWETTDRWNDEHVDVWFKSAFKNDTEVGFGWSHEEPITHMMKSYISSYHDLPRYVHQFQNKLRNEVRAKSGIMRCREFVMKDMYSYSTDEAEHMDFYNTVMDSYMSVFKRIGLGSITYVTSASGGVFTDKFSHEFQTICDAGEDTIYVHKDTHVALNEEIFTKEVVTKMGYALEDFEIKKAAEVGNIFTFGTKKCEQLGVYYTDAEGKKKPVFLGSYGIGVTRLLGVLTEIFSDEKGIMWPEAVAPFRVHVVTLGNSPEVVEAGNVFYEKLKIHNVETLYDDRDLRPGEKFADSDLIGIPTRVVISEKTIASGKIELKKRSADSAEFMSEEDFLKSL